MFKVFLLVALFATSNVFGQDYLDNFNQIYYSIKDLNNKDFDGPQAYIRALSNQMNADLSKLSSEEEKYVYKARAAEVFANVSIDPETTRMTSADINNMKKVELEMTAFEKKNKVGKEFLSALAALSSRTIHLESLSKTIILAKQNSNFYKEALKKDKNYLPAILGQGLWYFYAPKVGGGDLRKAMKNFQQVADKSTDDRFKYEAHIWISQVLFRENKKDEAKKELEKAAAIYPTGVFHRLVQLSNDRGNFFQMK